jgi:hypothetical protein
MMYSNYSASPPGGGFGACALLGCGLIGGGLLGCGCVYSRLLGCGCCSLCSGGAHAIAEGAKFLRPFENDHVCNDRKE